MVRHIEVSLAPTPQGGLRGAAIVLASVLALMLDASAGALINSGLPYLQGRVSASPDEGSWLLTTFNSAYYVTIVLSPWLFVRFGRKRMLLGALVGFAVTSLLLVPLRSLPLMLVLRVLQGAFQGAIFVPAGILMFLSLPLKLLPVGIPAFAFFSLGGGSIGPLIGGYFAENFGGGSVFVPGAAITLAIALLVALSAPDTDAPDRSLKLDVVGPALSFVVFGAMQYLANQGDRRNWFDEGHVRGAVVLLVLFGALYVFWNLRVTDHPTINLELFGRFPNLTTGALVNVLIGALGYGVTAFVAYMQRSLGVPPTLAGEMIVLRVAAYLVAIPLTYYVVARRWLDGRLFVVLAAVGTSLSFLAFGWFMSARAPIESFILPSLVFGFVFGALNQPTPSLVLGSLPSASLLGGLALYKMSGPIGSMLGTAASQRFLSRRIALHTADLVEGVTPANGAIVEFVARGGPLGTIRRDIAAEASVLSYGDLMMLLAGASLLVVPLVALLRGASAPAAREQVIDPPAAAAAAEE